MGKKSESKLENSVFQMMLQDDEKAKAAANTFYPDGVIAPFSLSSEQNPFASLLTQVKTPSAPQTPTQEQLAELCQLIRANVKQGKLGNVEIQLNKGRQMSDKQLLPLGNTAIKLRIGTDEPKYFFIKAGDTLNASIFLSSDVATTIMVIEDENGDDFFLFLSEFHMLSLRENPDPRKEVGLMTSFESLTSKVYSSIIFAYSLNPIKNLLLSEWLLAEWKRANNALLQHDNESVGGESHK